jgi:hypothetical protein
MIFIYISGSSTMSSVKAKISTTRSKNDKDKEAYAEKAGKQTMEMQRALDKFLGF